MTDWQMFQEFTVTFFSLCGLVILAYIIVRYFRFDFTEHDALEDAEFLISDYCNQEKNCEDCKKFLKDEGECKYYHYPPWKWKGKG